MKRKSMSWGFVVAVAVTIALIGAGTAVAQNNTSYGDGALQSNTIGTDNSAFGYNALTTNTQGSDNTATGSEALQSNTDGRHNTATGYSALLNNSTGNYNTAAGDSALATNAASNNTGIGYGTLQRNTIGTNNTATGAGALAYNKAGNNNTADGLHALFLNTGSGNTAIGAYSLATNTGSRNTAVGAGSLLNNSDGYFNVAIGWHALFSNTHDGNLNIGIGAEAGKNVTSGTNNIEIGNKGQTDDDLTIRIGRDLIQQRTYIAGIDTAPVSGADVLIDTATGQLGIAVSSGRFKHDIRDMGEASSKLLKLRPVSFRYNNDPAGTLQYGLVAEEVEKVYPELVTYGADGKVETVRYSMLTGMLLNELQKQARRIQVQDARNAQQAEQIKLLSAQMEQVTGKLSAQEQAMNAKRGNDTMARADK